MKVAIWVNGVWTATYENVKDVKRTRTNEDGTPNPYFGENMQIELTVSE